jgi:phosphatidylinositol alpha-1,6-mannosyltransferase
VGPAALLARRLYRLDVPIVSHHHHVDPSLLNPLIERPVLEASERVITVSEFSKRQLTSALGIAAERIEAVPNGVDEKFVPAPPPADLRARYGLGRGPIALFLGGLKARKNLPFLLDVWREVVRERPDARLVIAGDGPLGGSLRRQAESLGLGPCVVFTGRLPEADKVAHYNLADLFVFPSTLEGFGLAVAEAMSCGLPVVASGEGALPELVAHGEGGFVCGGGDRAAFVAATLQLLDQPELRRRSGAFNRERVDRQFRWPRAARRVLDIYEEVLSDWKRGVRRR